MSKDSLSFALKACSVGLAALIAVVVAVVPPRPHAAPIPQQGLHGFLASDLSKPFFKLPPGLKVDHWVKTRLRHAHVSYAWRKHGGKRELMGFGSQVQHVVVIIMENRTPDNLFAGYATKQYPPIPSQNFGQALDLHNPAASPTLIPNGLAAAFDPRHDYEGAFVHEAEGVYTAATPLCKDKNPANCPSTDNVFSYVPLTRLTPLDSDVQQYVDLIEQWAYAKHVMQSNEGPSFEAHQYAIAGQAGGVINWFGTPLPSPSPTPTLNAWGMVENPATFPPSGYTYNGDDPSDPDPDAQAGGGSCAQPNRFVSTIDMTQSYPQNLAVETPAPCQDYMTVLDLMQQAMPAASPNAAWQYIASSTKTIWSGPMAVQHLYNAYKPVPGSPEPFAADPDAQQLVTTTLAVPTPPGAQPFAALTYITPCRYSSDHPEFENFNNGPQWLAYVVNAIGNSPYWPSTVIFVTWDDWGGWYDHYTPTPFPDHPSANAYGPNSDDPYEWGFRVPLIVISPWVVSHGYISPHTRSQGAILNFIENAFDLPSLGTDDAAQPMVTPSGGGAAYLDDLSDTLNLGIAIPGATFTPVPGPTFVPTIDGSCPTPP